MDECLINPYVTQHNTGRSHGNGCSLELLTILYAVLAATLGWDGAAVSVSSRPSLEAVEAKPAAIAIPCVQHTAVQRPTIVLTIPSLVDVADIANNVRIVTKAPFQAVSILTRLGQRRE